MITRTLLTTSMLLSQGTVTSMTTKIKPFTATIAATTVNNLHNTMLNKKPAVLYHYPCPDGAFAALAAHLYFSSSSTPAFFFPNTVYSPLRSTTHFSTNGFFFLYQFCFVNGPFLFFLIVVISIIFRFLIFFFRAEDLPLNEIDQVYLLDFVGPSGFVDQLSSKVNRCVFLNYGCLF